MISTMYIGSGDVGALMAGKDTKAHAELMQRFVSGRKPHYNAKASPIDALRIGAILEERYLAHLPAQYFAQYHVQSNEMDVFKASLDFAEFNNKGLVDFHELKTMSLLDYIGQIQPLKGDNGALVDFVKRKYRRYYNQVQEQLYCTGLKSAQLVFLCVLSYDDEENYRRVIDEGDITRVRILRDENVITAIKERGKIFQQIKDFYIKK